MKFYVLRTTLKKDILGHYPQVKDIKYTCDVWNDPKFIENVQFKEINYIPKTANAILYDSSNLTDLIDVSGLGFTRKLLMSGKLKDILVKFRNTGMQFFESPVFKNDIPYNDYFVLNMFETNLNLINFSKSEIVSRERKIEGGTFLLPVQVENLTQFLKLINNNIYKNLFIRNIFLVENPSIDFFALNYVEGGVKYVVSENLMKHIITEGCIGLEFMPIEMKLSDWWHNMMN